MMTTFRMLLMQLTIVLLAACAAIYTQLIMGIEPCPLCILQRVAFIAIGVMTIVALIHRSHGLAHDIYCGLSVLCSLAGMSVALRQVWLQLVPPEISGVCGPGLNELVRSLGASELLRKLFYGAGDCAAVHWKLFGLSMAAWSALCFLLLFVVSFWGWTLQGRAKRA